jgi:hypothetical protein
MSSISKTADHARDATLMVRACLLELGSQALRLVNNIRERESNGVFLAHVGRRREPSHLSPAVWLAAGATLAGGAFFLLAPRGADLRSRIGSLIASLSETGVPRDRDGEDVMANEGGGSRPGPAEEHRPAH